MRERETTGVRVSKANEFPRRRGQGGMIWIYGDHPREMGKFSELRMEPRAAPCERWGLARGAVLVTKLFWRALVAPSGSPTGHGLGRNS